MRAGDAAAAQPYVPPEPDPEPEENLTPEEKEKKKQSTLQKIAALNPAQRLALAMKGTREERAVLIRDPNKIVAVAVLSSPKISESEVSSIAKMANVSEEILRIIGNTRAWMKSYTVTSALVKNPKTPIAVSMNLLQRLNEKDLKMLTTDRNMPDVRADGRAQEDHARPLAISGAGPIRAASARCLPCRRSPSRDPPRTPGS